METLTICDMIEDDPLLAQVLANCKNVKHLQMGYYDFPQAFDFTLLTDELLPKLQKLTMECSDWERELYQGVTARALFVLRPELQVHFVASLVPATDALLTMPI